MQAEIAYKLTSSDQLPDQLVVKDGNLILRESGEVPTFKGITEGVSVSLLLREDAVRLMDIKRCYIDLLVLINDQKIDRQVSELAYVVKEKDGR